MSAAPAVRGAPTDASWGRARKRAALAFALAVTLSATALASAVPAHAKGGTPSGSQASAAPYDITTRFAIASSEAPVYRQPSTHSAVLTKLAFYTPDNEALQTYRFVAFRRIGRSQWERIDVPMRPNGQTGWVKRSSLGVARTSHALIVVDIATESLVLYNHGKVEFTAPVGTGAPSTPTPTGHYWIAEAFPSSDPFYGPWAFGTTDYATDTDFPDGSIVGIHGTDQPQLIPGDPSHGCIRLKDEDILKLKPLVGIGTPIWIE
jgi:lipoprotein-anchoring transpeptidase ErfK/SrfK